MKVRVESILNTVLTIAVAGAAGLLILNLAGCTVIPAHKSAIEVTQVIISGDQNASGVGKPDVPAYHDPAERDFKPILKGVADLYKVQGKVALDLAKEQRRNDEPVTVTPPEPVLVPTDVIEVLPPDPPVDSVTRWMNVSHTNGKSWHGKGTAVVLCGSDRAESVRVDGRLMLKHGDFDTDKGQGPREIWSFPDELGVTGRVDIQLNNGRTIQFDMTHDGADDRGVTYGSC